MDRQSPRTRIANAIETALTENDYNVQREIEEDLTVKDSPVLVMRVGAPQEIEGYSGIRLMSLIVNVEIYRAAESRSSAEYFGDATACGVDNILLNRAFDAPVYDVRLAPGDSAPVIPMLESGSAFFSVIRSYEVIYAVQESDASAFA